MRTAICNGKVILPTRVLRGGTVITDRGIIEAVLPGGLPEGFVGQVVDAAGRYVSPGFVDIHTHGAGGHDYMDGTVDAIVSAARMHASHGATSILPTTLTSELSELFDLFDVFSAAKEELVVGPELLGIHLEGPYFSYEQRGAQDPRYLRLPEKEEYTQILSRSHGLIRRWSIAPELPGALPMGRYLREQGVVCSVAHTSATFEEVQLATENGYTLLTHFYSGMSGITRKHGFRIAGAIEAGYLLDELYVEVIADGCHLPEALLRLITKCKAWDNICLVTDSMRASGMPEGEYLLGSIKNGTPVIVEDGVAKLPDRTAFGGSVCTPDRLVRTMLQLTDLPLPDAVNMASAVPCRIMGIDDRKGSLCIGKDADIVLFDEDVTVSLVMARGNILFQSKKDK